MPRRGQWMARRRPIQSAEVDEDEGGLEQSVRSSTGTREATEQADDPWLESDPWHPETHPHEHEGWGRGWHWDAEWGWYKLWEAPEWNTPRCSYATIAETTLAENGRWIGARSSSHTASNSLVPESTDARSGRPTEKMMVPEFDGEASEADLGQTARSYLRRVQRPVALYSHLKGKAWVAAEELSVDRLADPDDGLQYFLDWIRIRFMEVELTKVATVMNLLFRKCRKKDEQTVREFNLEYERLLLHLRELECELPPLVKARLYLDKLRLSEGEEMSILSSVNNKYDLKLLQQAAMIHDKPSRRNRPVWDKDSGKRWGRQSVHLTQMADEETEDEIHPREGRCDEDSEDDLVTEEVAQGHHEAYVAFQDAKSKYREAMKGRGADPAELKKRSEARLALAKQRSYCGACKRKGHWHKDPECPLRGASTNGSAGAHGDSKDVKSVQLCHVYMVDSPGMEPRSALVASQSQGTHLQAIADTACSKTVAGYQWYQEYCTMADNLGIPVEILNEKERFKFGASRVHDSTFAIWARFCIQGKIFAIKVAVVACQLPLLFSRGVLAQLGMVYRFAEHQVDLTGLKIEKYPMGTSAMGHPTLKVADFDSPMLARIPIGDPRWGKDPDVRILAEEVYMSDAALSPRLFYPKKLNEVVESMLAGGEVSPVVFYRWWKDAKASKDFWLETDEELIRVHVVPRSTCFDPREWKTNQLRLKQALCSQLGEVRTTEAVPVVGMGIHIHVQVDSAWTEEQADVVGKHLGPWIGRSRFQRRFSKTSATSPQSADAELSDSHFAMGDAQGAAAGGTTLNGRHRTLQVDSARAQVNPHRATASLEAEGEQPRDEGHHSDDAARVDQEGRVAEHSSTGKAYKGIDDSPHSGRDTDPGRHGADLREVQDLALQRGPRGLHEMGHGGGECEPELQHGAEAFCTLVGRGAREEKVGNVEGEPRHGPQEGPGGQGSDPATGDGRVGVGLDGVFRCPSTSEGVLSCPQGSSPAKARGEERDHPHRRGVRHGGHRDLPRSPARAGGSACQVGGGQAEASSQGPGIVQSFGSKAEELGLRGRERKESSSLRDAARDEEDDVASEDEVEIGGTMSGPRATDTSSSGCETLSPKQKAVRGIRARKIQKSTRKKLFAMTGKLCSVLLTCAAAVGAIAEEVLAEPLQDGRWTEHVEFGAVKPLSVDESNRVEQEFGRDRILPARFLYRDKNLAKRRDDASIPCKAKARLCVGGQRDPDLGQVQMSVDAPTANRFSLLVGLHVALARGWVVSIGDIRAAFLNGVEAPRNLFFRQPARGIPGLAPGQLVEILKGVFGLSTSPKLWWLKLSKDLLSLKVKGENGEDYVVEQNEVDPCAFRVCQTQLESGGAKKVVGMIFTHVDDLMLMGEAKLLPLLKGAIQSKFPIDDWENDKFEYVGCEYEIEAEKVTIKQTGYVLRRFPCPNMSQPMRRSIVSLGWPSRRDLTCSSWWPKHSVLRMIPQLRTLSGPTVWLIKHASTLMKAWSSAKSPRRRWWC